MKRYVLFLINVLLVATMASAQASGKRAQMRERMYEKKVEFINDRVAFTTEEDKAFWPVYKEYMEKRREAKQDLRKMRHAVKNGEKVDYESYNDLVVQVEVDEAAISQEYYKKIKAILPPEKIYKLHMAEREFKKQLLERVHKSCKQ